MHHPGPRAGALARPGQSHPTGPAGPDDENAVANRARTPISSAPYTITDNGSYYLTTNLTVSGGHAITIAANNVTLDLNGFTISSTAPSATGVAILLSGYRTNVAIYNGHIQSGVTNDNAGVFGGPGFGYGISAGGDPSNVRVRDVSVRGVLYDGINLRPYTDTVVESCTVDVAGSYGIVAGTVSGSVARNCGMYGIIALTANDCVGVAVGSGSGLFARTANNCYGEGSSGTGLHADTANNCYGSSQIWYGLYAEKIATGCYGYSYSGPAGLYALNAAFCTGERSGGGQAIWAFIANGCWAAGGTNFIIYKYNMP